MKNGPGRSTTALIAMSAALVITAPASAQLQIGGQAFSETSNSESNSDANSNSLNQRVQRDLITLGYEPGSINGTMDDDTIIAISKFQTANGLTPDGLVSPQLAGILSARVDAMRNGTAAQSAAGSPVSANLAATAQPAEGGCEPQSEAAEESAERRGRFANAGSRLLRRFGGNSGEEVLEAADDVAEVADIVGDISDC